MPNACPFNNKQIELGQQKPKEFMDKMMETIISDLEKPKRKHLFKSLQIVCVFFIDLVFKIISMN